MPSKNVKIDVHVDVDQLYNGGSIDACCSLGDDNGGRTPNGKPSQFKSNVYASRKVTWEPEKTGDNTNDYDLDLTEIDFQSGKNIFGVDPLPAGSNGKVVGTVESTTNVGDQEKYDIKFKITKKRGSTKHFEIDPSLEVIQDQQVDF